MAGPGDPFGGFNFRVEIDGLADAGFSQVSGLGMTIDTIEYRNGNDPGNSPHKIAGLTRYGNVTLKRGLVESLALYEWTRAIADGASDAVRNVVIVLLDAQGQPVRQWRLSRARIVSHVSGPLDAASSAVAVEEIVLAHERLEIE